MKDKFWIAFSSIEALDSSFIERLYNHFGDIEKAFNATYDELSQIEGLSVRRANTFLRERDKIDVDKAYSRVVNDGIKFFTLENENYPKLLREIDNPPVVLYVKGDLTRCNLNRTLAVVGSRRASTNGKEALKKVLSGLAGTDVSIVSGLASGIDTTAHEGAIANGLKTIGVIASGFDFIYPNSNKALYKEIEDVHGAILSEYYPTFQPLQFRFPQRNRIVTGLSYGTLVVEAAMKSGALISAGLALEQNRELMCIPGLITNPNTEGVFKLLKQGAGLVTCSEDILNYLNWEILPILDSKVNNTSNNYDCDSIESKVLYALELEGKTFDEIQVETAGSTSELLTCLTTLELKGIIKQVEGDRYLKV